MKCFTAVRRGVVDVPHVEGEPILRVERPFRFYFHEVRICNTQGETLGSVRRNFSIVNRRYTLTHSGGPETYEIFGPLFSPWTFKILRNGQERGVIKKKWGGLLKELFSDADAFGAELPHGITTQLKSVFLGAVFLVDFAHFEENHRN